MGLRLVSGAQVYTSIEHIWVVLALGAFVIFTSSTEQLVATCIAGMLQNIMYRNFNQGAVRLKSFQPKCAEQLLAWPPVSAASAAASRPS